MQASPDSLAQSLQAHFGSRLTSCKVALGEVTIETTVDNIHSLCLELRDDKQFGFELLIDLCGVDYLTYGEQTGSSQEKSKKSSNKRLRFASVYHLLSIANNQRVRVRVFLDDDYPRVDSVMDIWSVADWYEREAFDLYGIMYNGHPDLRRLLTDYGFIGHPFRKDFPLVGNVEMRYDPEKGRVVYEPVTTELRVNIPRVIRDDHRYMVDSENSKS